MASAANSIWEVRTTGSDSSGGGFVPGTSGSVDYSQQNSAQFALTGIASAGSGNTILYLSAASSMVGNFANVVSGTNFNTGVYQIVSVVVGTSITFATNKAGQSICSGVGAAGVINIGGAFLTLGKAFGVVETGNFIWVAGGSYAITTGLTLPGSNVPSTNPMSVYGYNTVRGDANAYNSTRPVISTTSAITILTTSDGNVDIENLTFSTSGGTPAVNGVVFGGNTDRGAFMRNVFVTGPFTTIGIDAFSACIELCEVTGMTTGTPTAAIRYGSYSHFTNCFLHDCACPLLKANGNAGTTVIGGTYARATGANGFGIDGNDAITPLIVIGANFYNNSQDDIRCTNSYQAVSVENCIFCVNVSGKYGINVGQSRLFSQGINNYNFFYLTNGGLARSGLVAGANDVTLSGNPFTNAASNNFALNGTLGAGSSCRAAAFPGATAYGTGYIDSGALQHQDSGGGGTTTIKATRGNLSTLGR